MAIGGCGYLPWLLWRQGRKPKNMTIPRTDPFTLTRIAKRMAIGVAVISPGCCVGRAGNPRI